MLTIRQRHAELWAIRNAAAEKWSRLPPALASQFCRSYDHAVVRMIGGVDEVLSHAYLAFTRARNKFDPTRGFSFSTYATWAIKNEFKNMLRLFFNEQRLGQRNYNKEGLDVPEQEQGDSVERNEQLEIMRAALTKLPHRLHLVLHRRVWEGRTFSEISGAMGVTKARVQQLEKEGLRRMRCLMRGRRLAAWEDQGELWEEREDCHVEAC